MNRNRKTPSRKPWRPPANLHHEEGESCTERGTTRPSTQRSQSAEGPQDRETIAQRNHRREEPSPRENTELCSQTTEKSCQAEIKAQRIHEAQQS